MLPWNTIGSIVIWRPSTMLNTSLTSPSANFSTVGRDLDLEVALVLVVVAEPLDARAARRPGCRRCRAGGRSSPAACPGRCLLVADEVDVAHERAARRPRTRSSRRPRSPRRASGRHRRSRDRRWPGCPRERSEGLKVEPTVLLTRPRITASWTRRLPSTRMSRMTMRRRLRRAAPGRRATIEEAAPRSTTSDASRHHPARCRHRLSGGRERRASAQQARGARRRAALRGT